MVNYRVPRDSDPQESGQYPVGTIATFICNSGYSQHGAQITVCQSSGDWTDQTPTCIGNEY